MTLKNRFLLSLFYLFLQRFSYLILLLNLYKKNTYTFGSIFYFPSLPLENSMHHSIQPPPKTCSPR